MSVHVQNIFSLPVSTDYWLGWAVVRSLDCSTSSIQSREPLVYGKAAAAAAAARLEPRLTHICNYYKAQQHTTSVVNVPEKKEGEFAICN